MLYKIKPYKERKKGYCGPASLKMILESFGVKISENKLAELSRTTEDGVDENGLLKAVEALGFSGFSKERSSIDEIRHYIKLKKHQLLVGWFSVDEPHFSPVAGIDRKYIYLADPEKGKIIKFKIDKFINIWFSFSSDRPTKGTLRTRELVVIIK